MDLELQRTQLAGYELVQSTTIFHEETMEMIVPDACPDILRIVNTTGSVCVKGKEASDGRVEWSGVVKASALYLPDGEDGLRKLDITIPFSCTADVPGAKHGCPIVVTPRVKLAETRSLNPRKVLARVEVAAGIEVWGTVSDTLCMGIHADKSVGIQQMTEVHTLYLAAAVTEKPFTFSDDLSISGGRPAMEELLGSRIDLVCNEAKIIGNKLIFKGEAALQVLYRAPSGTLCSARWELPFSQIMEVVGVEEEADCEVGLVLTHCEVTPVMEPGGARTLSIALGILAQAVVREQRQVTLLTDTYSTACHLVVEGKTHQFHKRLEEGTARTSVREVLETGALARMVEDVFVSVGQTAVSMEDGEVVLSAETTVTVLYTDEEGELYAVSRQTMASSRVALPEGGSCTFHAVCSGEVQATPTAGGLEVRYGIDFRYRSVCREYVAAVGGVHAEEGVREQGASVVLRMMTRGERLWDIAKAYGTTVDDILQANELHEDISAGDMVLLIPKKR